MIGPKGAFVNYTEQSDPIPDSYGLFPRTAIMLLNLTKDNSNFLLTCSVLQDYMKMITCLTSHKENFPSFDENSEVRDKIEVTLSSYKDIIEVAKTIEKLRNSAPTKMNSTSSRSHCLIDIKM